MTISVLSDDLWNRSAQSDIWHPDIKPEKWKVTPKVVKSVGGRKKIFDRNAGTVRDIRVQFQIYNLQLWLALIRRMSEVLNAESIASILNQR